MCGSSCRPCAQTPVSKKKKEEGMQYLVLLIEKSKVKENLVILDDDKLLDI
jgi:hypothetical protein